MFLIGTNFYHKNREHETWVETSSEWVNNFALYSSVPNSKGVG